MAIQESAAERRSESQTKLNTLLETRTETLSLLNQLAGMRPFTPADHEIQLLLQEFCEALVDYTASAHFQLYQYIESGTERRARIRELANKFYPAIASTTAAILEFNEKYDCEDHCDNLSGLDEDLSKLGELLADRITHEDQIIGILRLGRG